MKPEIGSKEFKERINKLQLEINTLLDEKDFDTAAAMQIYLVKVMIGEK